MSRASRVTDIEMKMGIVVGVSGNTQKRGSKYTKPKKNKKKH